MHTFYCLKVTSVKYCWNVVYSKPDCSWMWLNYKTSLLRCSKVNQRATERKYRKWRPIDVKPSQRRINSTEMMKDDIFLKDRWCQRSRPAGGVCDKQIKPAFSSIFGQNGEQEALQMDVPLCALGCCEPQTWTLVCLPELSPVIFLAIFLWWSSLADIISAGGGGASAAPTRSFLTGTRSRHAVLTPKFSLNFAEFRCLHGAAVRRGGGGGNYSVDSPGDETGRRVSGGWRLWSVFCWFEIRSRNVESGFSAEVLLIPSLRRGERRKPCSSLHVHRFLNNNKNYEFLLTFFSQSDGFWSHRLSFTGLCLHLWTVTDF